MDQRPGSFARNCVAHDRWILGSVASQFLQLLPPCTLPCMPCFHPSLPIQIPDLMCLLVIGRWRFQSGPCRWLSSYCPTYISAGGINKFLSYNQLSAFSVAYWFQRASKARSPLNNLKFLGSRPWIGQPPARTDNDTASRKLSSQ